MYRFGALLLAGLMSMTALPAAAVEVGETVPDVTFKDIRYLPRELSELPEAKAYVLAFMTNTCPLAKRYLPKLVEMDADYEDVTFAAVNIGPDETIRDVAWHALEYAVPFTMLKDMTGETAQELGITRSPEILLYDADRVLRYRGRVDDQYRLGGARPLPSRHDLREALDEVLAGEEVSVPETTPEGCALTIFDVPEPERDVTWAEDIAPIFARSCMPCHNADGVSGMALDTFERASGRADMIAEVVHEERMPPWYAHEDFGDWANDRSLTDLEKKRILQWVNFGRKPGNLENATPMPEPPDSDWTIEPDLTIQAKAPMVLPATGFVPYKYVFFPYEFPADTWIEAIEIKPGNPRVVHHANLVWTPGNFQFDQSENFLYGLVPGGMPGVAPEGHAFFVPKGARLAIQIHYVTTGKVEQDQISVGLRYAKDTVRKRLYYRIMEGDIEIPPGARKHEVRDTYKLPYDVTGVALFSHMHLRGRDMTFTANYPDGRSEVMMTLPNYNFDWQLLYMYPPMTVQYPKGTVIECVSYYDNSAFNAYNPDPTVTVEEGPQTVDEMHNGIFIYTRNDEDLNIAIDPATGQPLEAMAAAE